MLTETNNNKLTQTCQARLFRCIFLPIQVLNTPNGVADDTTRTHLEERGTHWGTIQLAFHLLGEYLLTSPTLADARKDGAKRTEKQAILRYLTAR